MQAPGDTLDDDSVAVEDRLAQVLASRICHDLVSPVGAIVNGTDLIRELGAAPEEEEIALIAQSADRAAAVLAFHRLAFGYAGESAAEISGNAIVRDLTRMLTAPRIAVEVAGATDRALPRATARLAALLALAGRGLLAMTGRVRLVLPEAPDGPVVLEAGEIDLARKRHLLEALETPPAAPEPREVEYALVKPYARDAGRRVEIAMEGATLRLTAMPLR